MSQREPPGALAYWIPYFGFLLTVQFAGAGAVALLARVGLPLVALLYFGRRGAYPELRGLPRDPAGIALDVLVGLLGAALWMGPFILVDSLREARQPGFDPRLLGPSLERVALALRVTGFALVTPVMEELFVRSWLMRSVETLSGPKRSFREIPVATFTIRSFAVVVAWFTLSHARWEWPVAAVWILLTQLWFYHRRHLLSMVIVHAASNLAIFSAVVLATERLRDADGNPISLWFFL